jgi:hypothetical protein
MTTREIRLSFTLVAAIAAGPARAADPIDPPGAPVVKVIDPGAEPRQLLRYNIARKLDNHMVMEQTMASDMKMGDQRITQKMPTTRWTMDVEVAPDARGRVITLKTSVASIDVLGGDAAAPVVRQLKETYGKFVGLSYTTTSTPRGIALESSGFEGKPATTEAVAQVQQMTRQLSAPLPSEPIGKGAVWEVVSKLPLMGMTIQMKARWTVKSIGPGRVTGEVELNQAQTGEHMDLPNGPAGSGIDIKSMTMKGNGTFDWDLARFVIASQMQMDVHMAGVGKSAKGPGLAYDMDMKMQTVVKPEAR